jgi:hypothetical protein
MEFSLVVNAECAINGILKKRKKVNSVPITVKECCTLYIYDTWFRI